MQGWKVVASCVFVCGGGGGHHSSAADLAIRSVHAVGCGIQNQTDAEVFRCGFQSHHHPPPARHNFPPMPVCRKICFLFNQESDARVISECLRWVAGAGVIGDGTVVEYTTEEYFYPAGHS